jgi:hypothetical protein
MILRLLLILSICNNINILIIYRSVKAMKDIMKTLNQQNIIVKELKTEIAKNIH